MTTETMLTPEAPINQAYPLHYDVVRPEKQSRLTNFPLGIGFLIRYVLIIPHVLALLLLGLVAGVIYLVATFAILFSGRYPAGMHRFMVGYVRWSTRASGFVLSLYDKYPPFSMDPQADYPASLDVDYPEHSSRLLNLPLIGIYIKELLLIPHFLVLFLLIIVEYLILIIAPFAILFTGSFPAGMHRFVVGTTRWGLRVQIYIFGLTDKYPPFSMS